MTNPRDLGKFELSGGERESTGYLRTLLMLVGGGKKGEGMARDLLLQIDKGGDTSRYGTEGVAHPSFAARSSPCWNRMKAKGRVISRTEKIFGNI